MDLGELRHRLDRLAHRVDVDGDEGNLSCRAPEVVLGEEELLGEHWTDLRAV